MTDEARPETIDGPLFQIRKLRQASGPRFNAAVVLAYSNGDLRVLWPGEPPPNLFWQRALAYEVDTSEHRALFSVTLPTRDLGDFEAEIQLEWRVVDPAAVVRREVRSVRSAVWRELESRARRITIGFGIDQVAAAEDAINRQLGHADWPGWRRNGEPPPSDGEYVGAEYGLWTRLRVRLTAAPAVQSEWIQRSIERPPTRRPGGVPRGTPEARPAPQRTASSPRPRPYEQDARRRSSEQDRRGIAPSPSPSPPSGPPRRCTRKPSPTAPPVTYDEVVRRAFAELVVPGRLLFNPPDRMQLRKTARVEVRLTRTRLLDAELVRGLVGPGEPRVEDIPAAPLMAVTLKGDGFKIISYSDEEQLVTPDQIATWEFDIEALKRGQQRLVISVSLRIPIPGQSAEHKSIPVREATIDVQVGVAAAAQFVSANWQWFVGTAIAIGGLIVAIVVH